MDVPELLIRAKLLDNFSQMFYSIASTLSPARHRVECSRADGLSISQIKVTREDRLERGRVNAARVTRVRHWYYESRAINQGFKSSCQTQGQFPPCPTTTIATSSKSLAKPDHCTPHKNKTPCQKASIANMHSRQNTKNSKYARSFSDLQQCDPD